MHFMYFTEQPMNTYPEDKVEERVSIGGDRSLGVTALMFSNKYFDPSRAAGSTTSASRSTASSTRSASTASCSTSTTPRPSACRRA